MHLWCGAPSESDFDAFADAVIVLAIAHVESVVAVVVAGDGGGAQPLAVVLPIPLLHIAEGGVRILVLILIQNLAHVRGVRSQRAGGRSVSGDGAHEVEWVSFVGTNIGHGGGPWGLW